MEFASRSIIQRLARNPSNANKSPVPIDDESHSRKVMCLVSGLARQRSRIRNLSHYVVAGASVGEA
jgi:hypothetical protein